VRRSPATRRRRRDGAAWHRSGHGRERRRSRRRERHASRSRPGHREMERRRRCPSRRHAGEPW